MSARPVSLAFYDPAHALHGTSRADFTVLFAGGQSRTVNAGAELSREGGDGEVQARLAGHFDLRFVPVTAPAELRSVSTRVYRVEGVVGDARVECLGTLTETLQPPVWARLDAVRSVSAIFDEGHALMAVAERPRGARGHDEERVSAWLLHDGVALSVEEARISTVYDGEGRQRSASVELWLEEEDFPRRTSGQALAGTSLLLEGLRVNAAVFSWSMEGREGAGGYEVTVREQRAAA